MTFPAPIGAYVDLPPRHNKQVKESEGGSHVRSVVRLPTAQANTAAVFLWNGCEPTPSAEREREQRARAIILPGLESRIKKKIAKH